MKTYGNTTFSPSLVWTMGRWSPANATEIFPKWVQLAGIYLFVVIEKFPSSCQECSCKGLNSVIFEHLQPQIWRDVSQTFGINAPNTSFEPNYIPRVFMCDRTRNPEEALELLDNPFHWIHSRIIGNSAFPRSCYWSMAMYTIGSYMHAWYKQFQQSGTTIRKIHTAYTKCNAHAHSLHAWNLDIHAWSVISPSDAPYAHRELFSHALRCQRDRNTEWQSWFDISA